MFLTEKMKMVYLVFLVRPLLVAKTTPKYPLQWIFLASYTSTSPIVINEWMSNNNFGILDANGDASDWIELYNPSDNTISLNGYGLTDNYDNLFRWRFPIDATIPPNGYLLVFASEKNTIINGELHANFALGDDATI